MSFTERGEVLTKAEGPHHLERTNSNVCAWLIAAFGLIASGFLLVVILEPLIPRGTLTVLTLILTVLTLLFPFIQGRIFPVDEDFEISNIDMLRMTIASMVVPLYFAFVTISQYIADPDSPNSWLPCLLCLLALSIIFLIGFITPQPCKLLKNARGMKLFYASALSILGTTTAVVGIDANSNLPKENIVEIFSAVAFFVIVLALTLGYLSQIPKEFTSKLINGGAKLSCKNLAAAMGAALSWFFLWIVTTFIASHCIWCAILLIIFICALQTWAVDETSKWIFN